MSRQKMSGGFRKESGHEMYCFILTIIETLKRRNMGILDKVQIKVEKYFTKLEKYARIMAVCRICRYLQLYNV